MPKESEYHLAHIQPPEIYHHLPSVPLSSQTVSQRYARIKEGMEKKALDTLIIYADKEHGANFEYLTGFIPRFEEALLVIHKSGENVLILGNENLKLAPYSRLPCNVLHAPWFSLPNQPMETRDSLEDILRQAGLGQQSRIGISGWKYFSDPQVDNSYLFDIPNFIFQSIRLVLPTDSEIVNCTDIFISPKFGARTINNANEIAHYEYGANLASGAILSALNAVGVGKTEKEIAAYLAREGQPHTVISIAATGERFHEANLYPSDKSIQTGDKLALTTGFKGGLSSRSAYVVHHAQELPLAVSDYLDVVVKPYYHAVVCWLEAIRVGVCAGDIYQLIERVLPKSEYQWHLNPGHLVADEEWLCSPVYAGSTLPLKSGMLLQIDIIPSRKGYGGASIEDTLALADATLRAQIAKDYPELWLRINNRRRYITEKLNINIHDDVLPLSNTVGYLRPFLLNQSQAFIKIPSQRATLL